MKLSYLLLAATLPLWGVQGQSWAREKLNESPRHHEWVKVSQGDRQVQAFLVFPEVKEKATAVVVIHENRGLTDWVRHTTDQLAKAGYIAIAPDLLSGLGPNGGKTADFPDSDAAREAIYQLPADQVMADLNAVADFIREHAAANGKIAVAGFCWGGSQAFRFAGHHNALKAAFVFYGTAPEEQNQIEQIHCPVYGFYGSNDSRVNATIPKTVEKMMKAGNPYEPVIYEGAGHAFMRIGEAPDAKPGEKKAREDAWERWRKLLSDL